MKKSYFEGWYLKHCHDGKMFAVIPGISRDKHGNSEAFIQIIMPDNSYYIPFSENDFSIDRKNFYVKIGRNEFSLFGVKLYIYHPKVIIKGEIKYHNIRRLKSDIMGPFRFLPKMECRHGVLSMQHSLSGHITCNGNHMDFTGGIGYIESDKGTSFPQQYFWSQCNTFAGKDLNVMIAAGEIPYMGMKFMGCIAAVFYRGEEYRLATYNGARLLLLKSDRIVIAKRNLRLEARLLKSNERKLFAPSMGKMNRRIYEDPNAKVQYKFYKDGKLLFRGTSPWASFEYSRTNS